ncbi:MAG: hypothetical protein MJZ13_02170 [Bacteroidales bacterium]|nr:hypothetical protein [Bacteroidales bacterium]
MKIKNVILSLAVLAGIMIPTEVNSQAEAVEASCKNCFENSFVVTGKPFRALLTGDEVAEFNATLFSGTTYRIAAGSAGKNYIIFNVYDSERNLLFSNKDYDNAQYWDFSVDGYLDCIVEARLDNTIASSGFAIVMTGFKLNE